MQTIKGVTSAPYLNPVVAALSALTTNIGNVAVAFSLFGASQATVIESAVVGLISAVAVIANALHHKAAVSTPAAPAPAAPAA